MHGRQHRLPVSGQRLITPGFRGGDVGTYPAPLKDRPRDGRPNRPGKTVGAKKVDEFRAFRFCKAREIKARVEVRRRCADVRGGGAQIVFRPPEVRPSQQEVRRQPHGYDVRGVGDGGCRQKFGQKRIRGLSREDRQLVGASTNRGFQGRNASPCALQLRSGLLYFEVGGYF